MLKTTWFFILLLTALGYPKAFALIGGQETTGMSSVINYAGCTYFFVGLNPPTLMTAKHCVTEGAYPRQIQKIITLPFKNFKSTLSGDIAILIYPKNAVLEYRVQPKDIFTVAPVDIKEQDRVSLCGFGATNYSYRFRRGRGTKKCGSAFLVTENSRYNFGPSQDRVQYIHTVIQSTLALFGGNTHYAIGRFTEEAFRAHPVDGYDKNGTNVLTNVGDSGGPWFIRYENKNPHVVAVDSFGWELNNWTQDVVAGFAWRIDTPWTKALLIKARAAGADITGLDQLLP